MDQNERALLEKTVLDTLSSDGGADADDALGELGWPEMLADEPSDAVTVVFRALGATNRAASVLDDVVLSALGLEPSAHVAIVLPPFGESVPPAPGGIGLATARAARASEVLVVAEHTLTRVASSACTVQAVRGIDPGAGLHRVEIGADGNTTALDASTWADALASGRVAIAHQILGASRVMLELARTHALERIQFDRPIASFQAVRHRLAETLVAIEGLEASLDAAGDAPGTMTAALAKAVAGATAKTVAVHCQQVLAGIGFTTDHPFHAYLKRTMVLDGLLGSSEQITVELGRTLLEGREVPALVEL